MIPSETWTSWSFLSACTTWTTTGWSTLRMWLPSSRPWTASRGSSQVGSSWWNNDEINLLLSSRIDLLRRWWKPATYRGHSTESFWCFQGVSPASRLLVDHNSLFQSIDKDLDGTLTFQEFIEASSKRSEMHRRQASVRPDWSDFLHWTCGYNNLKTPLMVWNEFAI